jgi:hypothetical protein
MRSANLSAAMTVERVRLDAGRHDSPGEGACVVELASLVARERFSDRPECVCPVIAAFLRGWNDRSAYADRQRLRPYAQRIVGTRASRNVTRWRRDLCLGWVGFDLSGGRLRTALRRTAIRVRIGFFCGVKYGLRLDEGAAEYATRVLYGRRDVEAAFGLLDALLAASGNGTVHVQPSRFAPIVLGRPDKPASEQEPELDRV